MKKVKKISLIVLFLSLTLSSYSQNNNQLECTVVSVIHLADLDYAILNQNGTQNHFETSPYPVGELTVNQGVSLIPTRNNNFLVGASSLTINLYAELINNNNTNISINQINLPRLENGILFFESKAQYDITYDLIDNYMNQGDYDEMLDRIEATTPGFTSFRTWFNNEYNWLNGVFTAEELDRISKLDFVNDEIIKTLLNKDRLLGIADTVYQYNSTNFVLKCSKNNIDAINFMKTLKLDISILDVFPGVFAKKGIVVISHGSIVYPTLPAIPVSGSGGYYNNNNGQSVFGETITDGVTQIDSIKYTTFISTNAVNCSPTLRQIAITMSVAYKDEPVYDSTGSIIDYDWSFDQYYDMSNAIIKIDWEGNGTQETFTNYQNSTWLTHDYPTSSTEIDYYPIIIVEFNDFYGQPQSIQDGGGQGDDIELTCGVTCTKEAFSDGGHNTDSGNWRMHTKIWIQHNIFGSKIGCLTWSYKKIGNGWQLHKSDIYCYVTGKFRDSDCTYMSTKTGSKQKNLRKKIQKTKNKLFKYYKLGDGEVAAAYWMQKGNLTLQYNYALTSCP